MRSIPCLRNSLRNGVIHGLRNSLRNGVIHGLLMCLLACVFHGVMTTNAAHAQESKRAEEQSDPESSQLENLARTDAARKHFMKGAEHFQDRRFRDALREFNLAIRIIPSADLWYNIARAHEELREDEAAIVAYQTYLRDRVDPPDAPQVQQRIALLRAQIAARAEHEAQGPKNGELVVLGLQPRKKLSIRGATLKAPMWMEGTTKHAPGQDEGPNQATSEGPNQATSEGTGSTSALTKDADPAPGKGHEDELDQKTQHSLRAQMDQPSTQTLDLPPGRYRIASTPKGYIPYHAEMQVERGVRTEAHVQYEEKTMYRSVRGRALWAWVVAGLAVGAIGASIGLGIKAARAAPEDEGRWSTLSDAMLGTGIGLGVSSAVIYFIERRAVGSEKVRPGTTTPSSSAAAP